MKKIKPQIAKRVSLDEIGLSHCKLEQGQVRGTVVCLPWRRVSRRNIHQMDDDDNKDTKGKKKKKGSKHKKASAVAKEQQAEQKEPTVKN